MAPSFGQLRLPLLVLACLCRSRKLFHAIVLRQFTLAWGVTAFMCATEPAFRVYAPVMPYMMLDYVLLGCGVVTFMLTSPRKGAPLAPAVAYGMYVAREIAGAAWADGFAQ